MISTILYIYIIGIFIGILCPLCIILVNYNKLQYNTIKHANRIQMI